MFFLITFMFGQYGITPEFDSYGMNAVAFWYEMEDGVMSCWMDGEIHSYTFLNENGDLVRHEADLGPDAFYPQPLGPHIPALQGPRPITDREEYGPLPLAGFANGY